MIKKLLSYFKPCTCKKSEEPKAYNNSPDGPFDAYCVKCKEKRVMADAVVKVSDSGRQMAQGKCPICGTKVNRILGKVA